MYIACVSLRVTSRHTPLVTRAQSQFRVTLQFYPACGLALYAKGHHSLSSPFGVPCILSSTIFLRSASRRVTHHRHASLVTISLRFYLAFRCINFACGYLCIVKRLLLLCQHFASRHTSSQPSRHMCGHITVTSSFALAGTLVYKINAA